jgi:branched-chain amino acid transport system substrate-binding protein
MSRRRVSRAILTVLVASVLVSACTNSVITTSQGGTGAPGVTSNSIEVGSIADVTGPLSSDFAPVVQGVQAYFDVVNAHGGVAERKLVLAHQADDLGSPTIDLSVAQRLVEQDKVFAVVGVATPFFGGARYLAQGGVPTFGYVVSTDWANAPTLFGVHGSVLDFTTAAPGDAYIAQRLGAHSVAVVAYGVPQSAAACQAAVTGMREYGINVSFTDLQFPFGSDPTADVLQMKSRNVDLLYSCMDVTGSVAFARAIQQNGLSMHQVWFNGYDRSVLQQYGPLMNGVYLGLEHVPFEAASTMPGRYPGLDAYIRAMQRYEPAATYDEVALDGWISADAFVAGLKAVGPDLTQRKLVAALNAQTGFADGVSPSVNWTKAHSTAIPPYCGAGVVVQDGQFTPVSGTNGGVFTCFRPGSDTPVPPPSGLPGD